ncbi:MAG: FAD-dependent thymidylate synthase [Actinomycetota bacterium]|nr:FAD-dependent thymidylate synthase [Actinomycetota bacterium]|tara:strand:- start:1752 stop:3383 length:1632 start_codon:yes stop_codon:yes gene_type:complete
MTFYAAEQFDSEEEDILRRYFTNLDKPVFALVNLPEVVKGALFARYSRSSKSLRRLFLDEFVGELDISGDETIDATVGLKRAEELYDLVFFEYGDDSVAQLGGVHLACEQASNLLTKVLEWGRLMSYLEQSTRYIAYNSRLDGRYRYYRDPEIMASPLAARYIADMDYLFDTYSNLVEAMREYFTSNIPKKEDDSDFAYLQAIKAKALDSVRGVLPASSLSNVGIYGTGQAYEALLLRMRSHPLPEARDYAELILLELRKVIPSFLKRVDLPDRGQKTADYMEDSRNRLLDLTEHYFPPTSTPLPGPLVDLTDYDPDAEVKLVASALYPHTDRSDRDVEERVRRMTVDERIKILRALEGDRENRRHRPGRSLERPSYRFDVLADYGAFRDLQRHRMMTLEWQKLSPYHGFVLPDELHEAGSSTDFESAMERSLNLHDELIEIFPEQAPYAVSLAYRVRFLMHLNAREAMHMLELRTTPQGHPAYRQVCQEMHTLIAEKAGHFAIAEMMKFVDHSTGDELERLESEKKTDRKRTEKISNNLKKS